MTALLRASRLLLAASVLMSAAACDFGSTAPTAPDQSNVPYSQVDLTIGTGAEATPGTTAAVSYGAWLYSVSAADHKGTQIDSSQFSFVLGANQVIPGFDQGVTGMKEGGTRRLIVPPSLAYGSTGNQTVPPNAALVFDIALATVTPPQ